MVDSVKTPAGQGTGCQGFFKPCLSQANDVENKHLSQPSLVLALTPYVMYCLAQYQHNVTEWAIMVLAAQSLSGVAL